MSPSISSSASSSSSATSRRSRSGNILGPHQRVDVMSALKAMTIWPAWQYFEEKTKGSIETGKLADFVIRDKDPTAIDPEKLDTIKPGIREVTNGEFCCT